MLHGFVAKSAKLFICHNPLFCSYLSPCSLNSTRKTQPLQLKFSLFVRSLTLAIGMTAILTLISSSEKTDHALCHAVHVKSTDKGGKKWLKAH
jgi:hypothetical protein